MEFIPGDFSGAALILGTGGSSKAVRVVLEKREIPYRMVSRSPASDHLRYEDFSPEVIRKYHLIVNTSPLGMYPHTDACPDIAYDALGGEHHLSDQHYTHA